MQELKKESLPREYDAGTIAREIVDVAVDKKASDVSLLDIHAITTLADYFVLATGTSARQIRGLSSAVQEKMDKVDVVLLRSEGTPADGWVLLDYGQVIVHIFGPEERGYYDLERRWNEAPALLKIQ